MASYDNAVNKALGLSEQLKPAYLSNFKSALDIVAPNASGTLAKNLSALLSGQIPKDVSDQIRQYSAEANIKQGRFGQAASNRTARDLGLTSLDLITKGAGMLKSFMPEMPNISQLITGSMAGQEFDTNTALAMGNLAERSREFDVSSMLDRARLDSAKYAQDVQNEQFKSTLAANLATNREKTALEKFQLQLTANAKNAELAQRAKEFDVNAAWQKTTDTWNKQFENFAIGEQSRQAARMSSLAEREVAQKQSVANATAGFAPFRSDTVGSSPFSPAPAASDSGMSSWYQKPLDVVTTPKSGSANSVAPYSFNPIRTEIGPDGRVMITNVGSAEDNPNLIDYKTLE